METWTSWALALVQPFISRILIACGISLVTMTGVSSVMDQFTQIVTNSWSYMPSSIVALAQYAGVGQAFSIIGSAIATRIYMQAAARGVKFATTNNG